MFIFDGIFAGLIATALFDLFQVSLSYSYNISKTRWDLVGRYFLGFKEGKYIHSFYAEIGDVIEKFFYDVGILDKPTEHPVQNSGQPMAQTETETVLAKDEGNAGNVQFKVCPECNNRTLKNENGCDSCVDCGYSKCDK